MATFGPINEYVGNTKGQWLSSKTKVLVTYGNGSLYSTFMHDGVPYQVPAGKTAKIVGMTVQHYSTTFTNAVLYHSTAATADVLAAAPAGATNIPVGSQAPSGALADPTGTSITVGFVQDVAMYATVATGKYITLRAIGTPTITVMLFVQEI